MKGRKTKFKRIDPIVCVFHSSIAVGDQTFLGMQEFDFAQTQSKLAKY